VKTPSQQHILDHYEEANCRGPTFDAIESFKLTIKKLEGQVVVSISFITNDG
jgi:hypothetical protein